jgi:hypothetical protein
MQGITLRRTIDKIMGDDTFQADKDQRVYLSNNLNAP